MRKIPWGGIYVHISLHSGMAIPAINFFVAWKWVWFRCFHPKGRGIFWNQPSGNCLELRVNSVKFLMNQLCCQWFMPQHKPPNILTNYPGLRRGWFATSDTLETVQQKCFPAAPVVGNSCSAVGSTKTEVPSKFPLFWECMNTPASLQHGVTSEQSWVYTSQPLFLLSRRHKILENQQGEMWPGCPSCLTKLGDHREKSITWDAGIKGQMEFSNWRRLEREI